MATTEERPAPTSGSGSGDNGDKPPWYKRIDPRRITYPAPFFPLFMLFGLNTVDELDRSAFNVLAPNIRDHFHLSIQGILTLTSVVAVVGLLMGPLVGYFSDRTSRTRIALFGAAMWGGFSLFTALVPNIGSLYVARTGANLGRIVVEPTHNGLLADFYPPDVRAKVYYAHRMANPLGQMLGPLSAGFIAFYFTWRTPFLIFTIPTIFFVVLGIMKLREPQRGVHDRRAAGADEQTAMTEETPPTWREGFRMLYAVRSLRRIYFSLPFVAGSVFGIQALISLFWADVYGLDERARGFVLAFDEPFQMVGIVVGAGIAQRLLNRKPPLAVYFVAAGAAGFAVCIAGMALSPNLVVAVGFSWARALFNSMLIPGLYALGSYTIPPRARSLGYGTVLLWYVPGVFIGPIAGGIADNFGIRMGLIVLLPLYLFGFAILSSAGQFVTRDIQRVRLASLTQAEARKARLEGDPKILICRNVSVAYDRVQVLFNVDFEVNDGEIIALLGTNGAGKSTLLKAISGLVEPIEGAIIFDGRDITSTDAGDTTTMGAVQVPGGRGIFPSLTVEENLKVACWMYRRDTEYVKDATEKILGYFPQLKDRWNTNAGNLSGGEQQMLSLSQAFVARPKLLLIDELSLGLAPTIVQRLLDIVRAIHANGTAVVLVEQSVTVALKLAKRAVFMEKGEIRFTGPTGELLQRPDILRAVFLKGAAAVEGPDENGKGTNGGGRAAMQVLQREQERRNSLKGAPVILETREITKRYGGVTAVDQVSLDIKQGEILGLIGPNGAGKTTIFDLISGFQELNSGRVMFLDHDVTEWNASTRARAGLGRSFQDARLWPSLTVREAIAVAFERTVEDTSAMRALFCLPVVDDSERDVAIRVEELIELLGLGAFRDKFISELSTGSRRIVEIAATLAHRPSILLLDEPSSGIAQKETEALGPLLGEVRHYMGCSLLVIEHDMPLITKLADRIVALDLGRVIAQGTPEEVTSNPLVVESYLGTRDEDLAHLV